MFDEIYEHLLRVLDPNRSREDWSRIFTYDWDYPEEHTGYALIEGGRPVGFLGLIFSTAMIDGESQRFCNVTSWIVDEYHRAEAAALAFPLRNLKGYTVTNLTCTPRAYQVFARLKFDDLETHTRIILPPPTIMRPRPGADCGISHDPAVIAEKMDSSDRRTLEDHLPYAEHLLIWDDDGYCYVVYTRGRRRRIKTARIHHISDAGRFAKYLRHIQTYLYEKDGLLLAECDERFLRGLRIPTSYRKRLSVPRLFKSNLLKPGQISNLYSEIVMLNLA